MKIGTLDLKHLRGLSDKSFGLGKEVLGTVIGNSRLQDEGEAQQARGTENLKALRKQAEAEKHEAKADALEQKQRTAQRAKSA
jgi:uncharacterized protein YjbJ (UPF0337 family)